MSLVTANTVVVPTPPDDPVRAALDDESVRSRLLAHTRAVARGPGIDHEDIVQTVVQRAWANRAGYDPAIGPVSAWLAGFVPRVASERLRKKAPALAAAGQLDAVAAPMGPDVLELADVRAAAHRHLDSLDEPFRTAVEWRVMRDCEYEAVAARLGTSAVYARQLVSRGLNRLRDLAAKEDRS